jgi:tRNA threonylcarbamoyladenosine biosynthesis protein TsaE
MELQRAAEDLTRTLQPGEHATVIALSGDLGAGKTSFAQGIARALGVSETVSSPTFVIEKIYALEAQPFERLVHIDAYRITGVKEMEVLGWKAVLEDPGNLIVIEWPEKIADIVPKNAIRLRFDITNDGRTITTYGN